MFLKWVRSKRPVGAETVEGANNVQGRHVIIIIINRDLKSLPVNKHRSRLYNDGRKKEKKSEKKIKVKII